MSVRLIALDIDGTLLAPGVAHSAMPAPDMTQVIDGLLQAGVEVVLATGRMYPGTARIAQHLGVTRPLICQQGATTHALDGTVTHQYALEAEIAFELAAFARHGTWPYAWFDPHRYLVNTPNAAAQHFADVSAVDIEYHAQPEHSGVSATGVDVISNMDRGPDIHAELSARYGERVQLLDFRAVTAAHAPEATKGNALALLAAELGIGAAEVLAVGDSANDASMLAWAGQGASPAHCDDYARAAADEVLPGDGVDGVCALLQSVLDHL